MEIDEIARRRLVWEALSALFLDTETRWFLPAVAESLLRSGYSGAEIERIWRQEALPHFGPNLMQPAGAWDDLWVDADALQRRAEGGPGLRSRMVAAAAGRMLREPWNGVQALRGKLEPLPEDRRAAVSRAWRAFARVYLADPRAADAEIARQSEALAGCGLDREACERTFEADFRPIYRTLLLRAERPSEAERARHVTAAIRRSASRHRA